MGPSLLAEMSDRWNLVVGTPFDLSYSYVVRVRGRDGMDAVLKLAVPTHETRRQIDALRLYGGQGACPLIDADADRGAMLLERMRLGETLVALARRDDSAATRVAACVMRELRRPVPQGSAFRPLAEWFTAFARHRVRHRGSGPLPPGLFARAERLAQELLVSTDSHVLLHGDLHHYSILSAGPASWLAIDPKGMVGDVGYEVGPFLLDPRREGAAPDATQLGRRLDVLAEELGTTGVASVIGGSPTRSSPPAGASKTTGAAGTSRRHCRGAATL